MQLHGNPLRGVITDMDGVLWRGDVILPGVVDFIQHLIEANIPYVFATNNSSRTVENYLTKLAGLGIPAEADQILSSAVATAAYLAEQYPPGTRVHVVGEQGLRETLTAYGFTVVEDDPALVIAGIDRHFTYETLRRATDFIRAGVPFIGTNPDKTFPVPEGFAPGAGSVLAALEAAGGVPPQIIGKPAAPMFQVALERLGSTPNTTLMIGDRLETDIHGAAALGIHTALVLTGVATAEDAAHSEPAPDGIYADLPALGRALL
ncbi:MAG: HAD-IIA family hydrolase [Anaerolineales bacterium]